MAETLTLYPYGDTELHYASGDNWSLPLFLHWRLDKANDKHYALLTPPLGFYHSQLLCLQALLGVHDIMGRKDRWLIDRKMVEALLHKAPGITPVAYYKWPEPDMPAIQLPAVLKVDKVSGLATTHSMDDAGDTPNMSAKEPYISFIAERTGINKSIVRVIFKAMCEETAKWMLEKRQALDLGFCTLFAAPFRPNWKEIVAFKFKKWKLLEIFRCTGAEKRDRMDDIGMPGVLCSPHNIGIKKNGQAKYRVSYVLEAVPNRHFEKAVDAVERERVIAGGNSYVASFQKTVETLYQHLLAALETHLHKTSLPFARVLESVQNGQLRLVPTTGQSCQVRGVGLRHLPQHIISIDSPFSLTAEQSDQRLIQAQIPSMQELSDLPQADEDLRECAGDSDVDLGDGSDSAAGLSLLSSGEDLTTGKPVLPQLTLTSGDSSGMDRC